jgi:hypothetical protein
VHVISSIVAVVVLANLVAVSGALYLLPVLIGRIRRVPDLGSVAVINLLLGWTLVGWVVALALALRSARPPGPGMQIVNNLPAPAPVPPDARSWAGHPDLRPHREGYPPPLQLPPRPPGPGAPR